jgi:hypothetical protein
MLFAGALHPDGGRGATALTLALAARLTPSSAEAVTVGGTVTAGRTRFTVRTGIAYAESEASAAVVIRSAGWGIWPKPTFTDVRLARTEGGAWRLTGAYAAPRFGGTGAETGRFEMDSQ